MVLTVSDRFKLDTDHDPPTLKSIVNGPDGSRTVTIGRGVELRLGRHTSTLDALLDARVLTSGGSTGLGSVEDACSVFCASNHCREWARRNRRPRMVAKVVGIMADEPRYVLLAQPRLQGAERQRRESPGNRAEAGLVHHVLVEPGTVECAWCPSRSIGEVSLVSSAMRLV